MGRPRILPDKTTLARWRAQGLTYADMADLVYQETGYRVTDMAISVAMHRHGLAAPPVRYKKEIPWRVRTEHAQATPVRMLRLLARRRAGETLTRPQTIALDNWLVKLAESRAVVVYDPDTGFHYAERIKGDGRAIPIRPYEVSVELT
jgi:hypothetical protein